MKFILSSFLLFITFNIYSQSNDKVLNDLNFKSRLQGTWAQTPNGGPWIKIVITGDTYKYFSAHPSDGEWTDMTSQHKNNILVSFLKVTERSDYDGKIYSYNVAFTEKDKNGVYVALRVDMKQGKQILTYLSKGDKPSYNTRSGRDDNAPIIIENFYKKSANFNPWLN
jgi:hypothetical protein